MIARRPLFFVNLCSDSLLGNYQHQATQTYHAMTETKQEKFFSPIFAELCINFPQREMLPQLSWI
jgi:hypothetical protein